MLPAFEEGVEPRSEIMLDDTGRCRSAAREANRS